MIVGQHTGAIWRSTDLQCHTPRDRRWIGSPPLPGGSEADDVARDAWAADLIAAARTKRLTLVAVTDHHDFAMLPHVLEAAAAAKDVVVLPGMEITCRDTVQVLAIFEVASGPELWARMVSKLTAVGPVNTNTARGAVVTECGHTVAELFELVAGDDTLREAVLLIPHFGNETAYKSLNQPSWASRARALPCNGVYIECPHHELDPVTLNKIQGKITEWGSRRRAVVATGDNRNGSWERLGAHSCWIKLGENSLEGLRQAFLADEARITYSAPIHPSESIVSIEVLSTLTGDTPVKVTFNTGFNAFIGGRGSGKSAFLEYLRFGLGKSDMDLGAAETQGRKARDREAELVVETLANGWVAITIEQQGAQQVWTRRGSRPEVIEVGFRDGNENLTVEAAQRRFPARAFHQKELSTTMLDPASAADNITGIAAAEAIKERRRIESDMVDAKRALNGALLEVAAHWRSELALEQARSQVEDIQRRLAAVRDQLAQGGVTPVDLEILAASPRFDRARNYLEEVSRRLEKDRAQIEGLLPRFLREDGGGHLDVSSFKPIRNLDLALSNARGEAQMAMQHVLTVLKGIDEKAALAKAEFEGEAAEFGAVYQLARARQAAHQSLIAEGEGLTAQLAAAAAAESSAEEQESLKRSAQAAFAAARSRLTDLAAQRRAVLEASAAEIGERSAGTLSAGMSRDKRPAEMVSGLCALFTASYVRDPEVQCEVWVSALLKTGAEVDWSSMCDCLVEVYRAKIKAGGPDIPGADAAAALSKLLFNGVASFRSQQIARIYANLNDQTVGAVLGATPRDTITLMYVKGRQQTPFHKASSGEQASALLRLLLRQSAGTLIIDQPEDDLDNRVVMDIVKEIRTSKNNRQLIFATHNPNLVVNGDADKVLVMRATVPDYKVTSDVPQIQVEVDGAIETPAVRHAITLIMEGGTDAFELRARKYAGP